MKLPSGFEMAGVKAGIKPSGRPDLGLIYSPQPLYWALASTENRVRAPCVLRNRAHYETGQPIQAVAVNSGNANCANGDRGIRDNEDFADLTASALELPESQSVLTASTGVIGVPLSIDNIRQGLPRLTMGLEADSDAFAESVLTTDTCTKQVAATLRNGARIVGVAKGCGMVHPNMATLLAFVVTDASIPQDPLRDLWPGVVDRSFNQVSVDGDMSTNDMAVLMSSNQLSADAQEFADALDAVCRRLAEKLARDGEGATKLIIAQVRGGRSPEEARRAARAVVASPLVKTAAHGNDPNWGRILATVGASGVVSDQANLRISLQGTTVYHGARQDFDEQALSEAMKENDILIEINLAAGEGSGSAWGCDLSSEYVRINAEYTT